MQPKAYHEMNRLSWNAGTRAHNSHKGDQAAFFRAGGNTLFAEEMRLLGSITGKTLLHLQCNCGQDSLSIANHLGAQVSGVDISDEAIRFARQISRESAIEARFIRSDVYDYFEDAHPSFDIVFTSYGALCWLSDLSAWGKGIARCLKPGGRLVLIDFHPALLIFDDDWRLKHDYMGGVPCEVCIGRGRLCRHDGRGGGNRVPAARPARLSQSLSRRRILLGHRRSCFRLARRRPQAVPSGGIPVLQWIQAVR